MTTALEGGEWSAARPGHTLPPGKTWYPFYRRLGWPQGRSGRAENLVPTGIRSPTVQPIVSRYTDWATRPTSCFSTDINFKTISWQAYCVEMRGRSQIYARETLFEQLIKCPFGLKSSNRKNRAVLQYGKYQYLYIICIYEGQSQSSRNCGIALKW